MTSAPPVANATRLDATLAPPRLNFKSNNPHSAPSAYCDMTSRRSAQVSAPAARVYKSTRPAQQVRFKPKRQRVYGRHNTGDLAQKRQETLTQIGFVAPTPLTDAEIDAEIDSYERKAETRGKRRKTTSLRPTEYTQTITQMPSASRGYEDGQEDEEEGKPGDGQEEQEQEQAYEQQTAERQYYEDKENKAAAKRSEPQRQIPRTRKKRKSNRGAITIRCIKKEPSSSPPKLRQQSPVFDDDPALVPESPRDAPSPTKHEDAAAMPPSTPTRRTLEVPSSQSPATPLSLGSPRTPRRHAQRSPLAHRRSSITAPSLPFLAELPNLRQSQISTQAATQESAVNAVPSSSPTKPARNSTPLRQLDDDSRASTLSQQTPSKQVLSELSAAQSSRPPSSPPRRSSGKYEIADSDADSEDDLTQEPAQSSPLRVQVPSSPAALQMSSPLRRPPVASEDTPRGRTQWTGSQLLPDSIMEDNSLPVPPVLDDSE